MMLKGLATGAREPQLPEEAAGRTPRRPDARDVRPEVKP
jgi:hypothetical protein